MGLRSTTSSIGGCALQLVLLIAVLAIPVVFIFGGVWMGEMEWTPLIIGLTVAYFLVASVTTLDIRLIQGKRDGTLPPDEPMLPAWTAVFTWAQWGIFLTLLYLNWKYALALFVIKFVLKVWPVLETIGNVLMAPFKPR